MLENKSTTTTPDVEAKTDAVCSLSWKLKEVKEQLKNYKKTKLKPFVKHCRISGEIFETLLDHPVCYSDLAKNKTLTTMQISQLLQCQHLTNSMLQDGIILANLENLPNAATLQPVIHKRKLEISN